MEAWQEIQMHLLLSAENETAFFSALSKTARELGFDYCAYGMRLPLPVSRPKVFMTNNYPDNWQERYNRENYLAVDPTVAHGMRSVAPLVWSDDVFSTCRPFWEEARAHGLNYGWAQSCFDSRRIGGMLTLARSEDRISAQELQGSAYKMSWMAHLAHQGMSRLLVDKLMPEAGIELSPREAEVLRWTAEGKTSSEVSEILNISERTVNFHVNNALVKLGAANKTAAAIKALMLGLI